MRYKPKKAAMYPVFRFYLWLHVAERGAASSLKDNSPLITVCQFQAPICHLKATTGVAFLQKKKKKEED